MRRASTRSPTRAERSRNNAGISLDDLAKRTRMNRDYLRSLELNGVRSFGRALRLAAIYGCSPNDFLPTRNANAIERNADGRQRGRTGATPMPSATGGADTQSTSMGAVRRQSKRYRRPATPVLAVVPKE